VRSPADGNTLLVSVNTLVMNRGLYPQLPFDPVKDLVPVSLTSWGQLILVTPPSTGFKTAQDLEAAARARPGKLNYASPGIGTPHHMSMELFKQTAGVYLTHIPYRGTAQAVTDLLGGQVDAMFLPIHVALPQIKAGRLVALAIGSNKRHPLLPDLPTLKEANAGDVNVDMWYGIFAPPGTPPDQVVKLNRELKDILAAPEVRTAFESQGMDPASSSPDEFRRLVTRDADRWAALIRAAHIKAE
jgi:tripartite-type tricarboxylate transporter receptor subunit TctC